jgi:hypothetical protein
MNTVPPQQMALRNELLRIVLRDTLRKTGIPPQWIGGETTPAVDEGGRMSIEIRLILECNEPRLLYYIAAFQKEFEAALLGMEPKAWDWVSRISWSLSGHGADLGPGIMMPGSEYWQEVVRDRHVIAHRQAAAQDDGDDETTASQFPNTEMGESEFPDTQPPLHDGSFASSRI